MKGKTKEGRVGWVACRIVVHDFSCKFAHVFHKGVKRTIRSNKEPNRSVIPLFESYEMEMAKTFTHPFLGSLSLALSHTPLLSVKTHKHPFFRGIGYFNVNIELTASFSLFLRLH